MSIEKTKSEEETKNNGRKWAGGKKDVDRIKGQKVKGDERKGKTINK
jgi:hypothetical protein